MNVKEPSPPQKRGPKSLRPSLKLGLLLAKCIIAEKISLLLIFPTAFVYAESGGKKSNINLRSETLLILVTFSRIKVFKICGLVFCRIEADSSE